MAVKASLKAPKSNGNLASHGSSATKGNWLAVSAIFTVFLFCGYGLGYLTRGMVSGSSAVVLPTDPSASRSFGRRSISSVVSAAKQKWPGNTIHSVFTSSGDGYLGFQSRIMYATYKMIQKMPGGERHTGFTRILHRTVPDILMDEIPTFWTFPHRLDCDGFCDYPVANRPYAIRDFFQAARKNESMIQGAWVFMLETDYVWMQPMKVPGSAWDPDVPAVQFFYDYILPAHPDAAPSMRKVYPGPPADIPPSGVSPVLMRLSEWEVMVPEYLRICEQMEKDPAIVKSLNWVREMYAWDAALALHKEIKIRTEHPPKSTTIVQPPFDVGLDDAAMCHYTWGALYHEGLPSKNGKQIYRWEKRDYTSVEKMLKPPKIPMPPEFKEGWILEFDAPLTRPRHDLVVKMLTQMNAAIDTLPDLTQKWQEFQPKLKQYEAERDAKVAKMKAEEAVRKNDAAQAAQPKATSRRLRQ